MAFVDWGEVGSDADLELARSVMETNLFGAWRVTQALLPLLRESAHARVVNVSSGAGSHGDEAFGLARRGGRAASYGVSKAALGALTASLAAELDGTGILINAVCPGLTATWPGAVQMWARPVADERPACSSPRRCRRAGRPAASSGTADLSPGRTGFDMS